jgi:hypothetical protein
MEPGNESRDLAHVEAPSTPRAEADADIAQLIHKVGAKSIAEIVVVPERPDTVRVLRELR